MVGHTRALYPTHAAGRPCKMLARGCSVLLRLSTLCCRAPDLQLRHQSAPMCRHRRLPRAEPICHFVARRLLRCLTRAELRSVLRISYPRPRRVPLSCSRDTPEVAACNHPSEEALECRFPRC